LALSTLLYLSLFQRAAVIGIGLQLDRVEWSVDSNRETYADVGSGGTAEMCIDSPMCERENT